MNLVGYLLKKKLIEVPKIFIFIVLNANDVKIYTTRRNLKKIDAGEIHLHCCKEGILRKLLSQLL